MAVPPYRPGASRRREVIQILTTKGLVVLPRSWDHAYTLEKVNEWLRSALLKAELVEHSSLDMEGVLGVKVYALLLKRPDPSELPQRPLRGG